MDTEERQRTWENEYERTWELVREDESGRLQMLADETTHQIRRKRIIERQTNLRLGFLRQLFIIIDMSEAMNERDYRPTRIRCTLNLLSKFVREFFTQNPIGSLGIIVTRRQRAEQIAPLSGDPEKHVERLRQLADSVCEGEPSLKNSLDLAYSTLRNAPPHASCEILLVFGSLTTCDPSDVFATIRVLRERLVRCSMLSVACGEVRLFRKLCDDTGGRFDLLLDADDFKQALATHLSPSPLRCAAERSSGTQAVHSADTTRKSTTTSSLIKMAFPQRVGGDRSDEFAYAQCVCHNQPDNQIGQRPAPGSVKRENETHGSGSFAGAFVCPQCMSKYCVVPVQCSVCGLCLVSAPHLTRAYQHLFPLAPFRELRLRDTQQRTACANADTLRQRFCFGCQTSLSEAIFAFECAKCKQIFCRDCDMLLHDSVNVCPGCSIAG